MTARFLDTAEGRLRLPPSRAVDLGRDVVGEIAVTIEDTRRRVCSKCDRIHCGCAVTKEEYSTEVRTDDPRRAVIVAYLADLVHEALEWVTLDGRPLVDPHAVPNSFFPIETHLMNMLDALET